MTFFLEIIGTIAFAFAGALIAIDNDLDLFGIVCMAVMTACGGGMTRDVLLGNTPPMMFRNPVYVAMAIVVAFSVAAFYGKFNNHKFKKNILDIVNILDAIGLAIFTIVGMDLSISLGFKQPFLVCFMGVVTAVGGGLIRDIMVNRKPVILTKEVYAVASLIGSIVYFYALKSLPVIAASTISMIIIFGLRMWAIIRDINLPIIDKNSK